MGLVEQASTGLHVFTAKPGEFLRIIRTTHTFEVILKAVERRVRLKSRQGRVPDVGGVAAGRDGVDTDAAGLVQRIVLLVHLVHVVERKEPEEIVAELPRHVTSHPAKFAVDLPSVGKFLQEPDDIHAVAIDAGRDILAVDLVARRTGVEVPIVLPDIPQLVPNHRFLIAVFDPFIPDHLRAVMAGNQIAMQTPRREVAGEGGPRGVVFPAHVDQVFRLLNFSPVQFVRHRPREHARMIAQIRHQPRHVRLGEFRIRQAEMMGGLGKIHETQFIPRLIHLLMARQIVHAHALDAEGFQLANHRLGKRFAALEIAERMIAVATQIQFLAVEIQLRLGPGDFTETEAQLVVIDHVAGIRIHHVSMDVMQIRIINAPEVRIVPILGHFHAPLFQ